MFQDTDSEKQYALLGEEDSRGVKNEILFVVHLFSITKTLTNVKAHAIIRGE